jgi:hypothetical protein
MEEKYLQHLVDAMPVLSTVFGQDISVSVFDVKTLTIKHHCSGELKRTGNEMIHTLKFRMAGIRGKV